MATGVQPREEDHQFTRNDIEALEDAMKNKKFRELLGEYFEEIRDPVNQELYQKEMTQLEKERGYDVKFINPKGSYVIKTSVAGDRKAFINICSNDNVNKPSYTVKVVDGRKGMNWSLPYSLIPPREDYDNKRQKCVIYDVVFHPDAVRMAQVNKQFRDLVNSTAFDALRSAYNIELDCNNVRFPKSYYKGLNTPAVIRKEDPNFKPPSNEDNNDINPEILEKLYPQKSYPDKKQEKKEIFTKKSNGNESSFTSKFLNKDLGNEYTIPKYLIKQQKSVDIQDYTFEKNTKEFSAIPSHLNVEINLPLLSSTSDCSLDIKNKKLMLLSEKPAKYKLDLDLPYLVDDKGGTAKFDGTKRILSVTLPVIKNNNSVMSSVKTDSGVDSEDYQVSQSDEDISKDTLVSQLSSDSGAISIKSDTEEKDVFLDTNIEYVLPSHTHNILDDMVAFTFHVKNTDPESVIVKKSGNKVQIKFTSIGGGFVPIHYAALILFEDNIQFENMCGEAWDNNVILQIELAGSMPNKYQIGLFENALVSEYIDLPSSDKVQNKENDVLERVPHMAPTVEVTNTGTETNILVYSKKSDIDDDDDDDDEEEEREAVAKERAIVWVEDDKNGINAKSILRKHVGRSLSESSIGEVASSMDYISSDCIPEESSFKKTVRFCNSISKQTYRYNSSIEGQKKKNQRKKSKKRNLQRRKSQSDAEEEGNTPIMNNKTLEKSMAKERRDSGLADTSDADTDSKGTPNNTPDQSNGDINKNLKEGNNNVGTNSAYVFREKSGNQGQGLPNNNIKHNTQLYNPDKLNKGQYVEVKFKNDLIFDLDM